MEKSVKKPKDNKGKIRGGVQFKQGNPGGPGRPKDTPYFRLVKGKLREEFYSLVSKYWSMPVSEVEKLSANKDLTMSDQMFLRWYANRLKDPSNEDMLMISKMLGIKLEQLVIDHLSSDGSHSGITINANDINMKVDEAKNLIKSLGILEADEWSK